MSEHYHALVWIDHHEARIFHFNAAEVDSTTVRSSHPHQHIHHKANTRGSGHAPVDEAFLEHVTQAIMQAGAILITGPANSGKAGAVLDGFLAAQESEPLLVVQCFTVDFLEQKLDRFPDLTFALEQ